MNYSNIAVVCWKAEDTSEKIFMIRNIARLWANIEKNMSEKKELLERKIGGKKSKTGLALNVM